MCVLYENANCQINFKFMLPHHTANYTTLNVPCLCPQNLVLQLPTTNTIPTPPPPYPLGFTLSYPMGPLFSSRVDHHTVLARPTPHLSHRHCTPPQNCPPASSKLFPRKCTPLLPSPTTLSRFIGPNEVT